MNNQLLLHQLVTFALNIQYERNFKGDLNGGLNRDASVGEF